VLGLLLAEDSDCFGLDMLGFAFNNFFFKKRIAFDTYLVDCQKGITLQH
jgi:hypothetical protein